jgi:hypothetical protein
MIPAVPAKTGLPTTCGMASRLDMRWSEWTEYVDAVERGTVTLFHTRWMWRTLTGILDRSAIEQHVVNVVA